MLRPVHGKNSQKTKALFNCHICRILSSHTTFQMDTLFYQSDHTHSWPRSVQRKAFASHSMTECKNRQICSKKPRNTMKCVWEKCDMILLISPCTCTLNKTLAFFAPTKKQNKTKNETWIQNLLIWCYIVQSTIPISFLICPSSFPWSQPLRELSSVVPVRLYPPAHSSCTFHRSENVKHRIVCSNPLLWMPTVSRARPTLVGRSQIKTYTAVKKKSTRWYTAPNI